MPKTRLYTSGTDAGYQHARLRVMTQDDVDNYQGHSASFKAGMQKYVDEDIQRVKQDNVSDYDPDYTTYSNPIAQNILAQQKLQAWNSMNQGDITFDQAKVIAALSDPENKQKLDQMTTTQDQLAAINARNTATENAAISQLAKDAAADPHKGQYIVWNPIDPTLPLLSSAPVPKSS